MVGISEDDLRIEFEQLARTDRFHAALRSHRHERRRIDRSMRRRQPATARARLSILPEKLKHAPTVATVGEADSFLGKKRLGVIVKLSASATAVATASPHARREAL